MKKILSIFFSLIVGFVYSQSTVTVTINSPGSSSWQVPCGITSITVQCWGAGGAGGYGGGNMAGGGGGGGGFASSVYAVTAGSSIGYTVGAGGTPSGTVAAPGSGCNFLLGGNGGATSFSVTSANGGNGGQGGACKNASTGAIGTGGTGIGTTTVTGTNGGTGSSGGAGGWVGGVGGAGASGGGTGGAGGVNFGIGTNGNTPGGGGGGGSDGTGPAPLLPPLGGFGGDGQIRIIYTLPIIVNAGTDIILGTCTTTNTSLSATAVSSPWSGSWSCSGCSGTSITNPNIANSAVSGNTVSGGFLPGSTTSFIWTVTNGTCSYQDEVTVSVPACAQANPTCATALNLSIDNSLICGQNTNGLGAGADGCVINGTGQTVWYSFTVPVATTSLVLNVLGTAAPYPNYGLFSGSCSTLTCAQNVTYSLSAGDPGKHTLLTGLTPGATYYIQVQSSTTANSQFCISINNIAINSTAPANALSINNCGVTFNGTTNGGYYPSGSSAGFNNLDNNNGTTVGGASQAGDDVTFVVNNVSWFKFCSVNTGTYNVQFDVVSCAFSGANSGSQMAILTGTNTSMTNIWQATNPTQPATAVQTSPNFSLAAGGCAYLVVDGFAGDACSYSYVLTNVAGGCILLPIELISFNAIQKDNSVELAWATATELNNDFYTIERSDDGINFKEIEKIDGAGMSANVLFYSSKDIYPLNGLSYYRLKQTDFSGRNTYSKMVSVEYKNTHDLEFEIVPNPNIDNVVSNIVLNTIPNGEVTIEITNTQGEMLYEVTKKQDSNKIEIPNHFSKGIYFVKVIHADFIQTKRMMIK